MVLTRQEEAKYIEQYKALVWQIVHRFKRRMTTQGDNREDLFQEAIMVLLDHIRSCRTQDELSRIPVRDMINAMCRYVMGEQVVTIPKRTTDFSKSIAQIGIVEDYSALETSMLCAERFVDDILDNARFHLFLNTISENDKKMIDMKLRGMSNREIAHLLRLSDVQVCRAFKRMKQAYLQAA